MVLSKPPRRFNRLLLYLLGAVTILLALCVISYGRGTIQGGPGQTWTSVLDPIRNETLGFQAVFAINLPNRVDKRDAIVLGSSITDFRVQWIDGVTADEIDPKTYPYNWNFDHKTTEYAARRAHLNGMGRIVNERLSSAVIMEDDVDWDVTIKAQLQRFALAVRALQGASNVTTSPYGEDWDVLWLGHCGLECKPDVPFFLTPNDPTILPPHHFLPYWRDPPPLDRPDHARLTCAASDGVCSIVYAVSYHGAQRILSALSVDPTGIAEKVDIGAEFDVSLGRMCGSGYLRCFAPYPSLTGGYEAAGSATKSSDIHAEDRNGKIEAASSSGVMYSLMMNINRILNGDGRVHANWDDAPVPVIDPSDISVAEGTIQLPGGKS